jgi:hypothetical protein
LPDKGSFFTINTASLTYTNAFELTTINDEFSRYRFEYYLTGEKKYFKPNTDITINIFLHLKKLSRENVKIQLACMACFKGFYVLPTFQCEKCPAKCLDCGWVEKNLINTKLKQENAFYFYNASNFQLVCIECEYGWGLDVLRMCSLICSPPCGQCGYHYIQNYTQGGWDGELIFFPNYICIRCLPGFTVQYVTSNGIIKDWKCISCLNYNKDWKECQLAFPLPEFRASPNDLRGNSTGCRECQSGGICAPSKSFSTPKGTYGTFVFNDDYCFFCKGCNGDCNYFRVKKYFFSFLFFI